MHFITRFIAVPLCTVTLGWAQLESKPHKWISNISAQRLEQQLRVIAADSMEGRDTGSAGQQKAARYMMAYYRQLGIGYPPGMSEYLQPVPASFLNAKRNQNLPDSANLLAFIEGSDLKSEVVVLSAHYDHVGIQGGQIHNGADDDGSGTVALMEIARVLQEAKNKGKGPRRSILILHATGEEHGLLGSEYYSKNPILPLAQTVADVNIDMIGRRDEAHSANNGYVYLIGSNFLSSDLHRICEGINQEFKLLQLDYTYNSKTDKNRFYYRSDHYNFAKNGIPSVFIFSGVHPDYHKPTDDVDKIEFDAMQRRTQLALGIVWEIANRQQRLVVDGTNN